MKNYKECEKMFIGASSIASLTLRMPRQVEMLNFGSDGAYHAYICDFDTNIPSHYKKVLEVKTPWMKIYDDEGLVAEVSSAKKICIYRAGEFGVIIQTDGKVERW